MFLTGKFFELRLLLSLISTRMSGELGYGYLISIGGQVQFTPLKHDLFTISSWHGTLIRLNLDATFQCQFNNIR